MAPRLLSSYTGEETFLRIPHPYLTNYVLCATLPHSPASSPSSDQEFYTLLPHSTTPFQPSGSLPPSPLHRPDLAFSAPVDPKTSDQPPESNNTFWGRARRSPASKLVWGFANCPSSSSPAGSSGSLREKDEPPTIGQIWLVAYALFTTLPTAELIRLTLLGPGHEVAKKLFLDTLLAISHPSPANAPGSQTPSQATGAESEILLLRSTFWQGAGSPFGSRPTWAPLVSSVPNTPSHPLIHTLTYPRDAASGVPDTTARPVRHPIRPPKPAPGSVIYSRWIPHLRETFSMVAIDVQNEEHLNLFHTWQNDPRVSAGWNESGTLDHHRAYLQRLLDDPGQLPVLAYWDETPFAYFEIYWCLEDRLGSYVSHAYSPSPEWDRGRHSLVGNPAFRGPHRVPAWWGSLIHYLFLDEPRTMRVVGEPKKSNSTVLMYDFVTGFGVQGWAELPHKRSAMVGVGRERFFEICPLGGTEIAEAEEDGRKLQFVGGTGVGLVPKL